MTDWRWATLRTGPRKGKRLLVSARPWAAERRSCGCRWVWRVHFTSARRELVALGKRPVHLHKYVVCSCEVRLRQPG